MKPADLLPSDLPANPAERLVDAIDLPIGRWVRAGAEARLVFCNRPYTQ